MPVLNKRFAFMMKMLLTCTVLMIAAYAVGCRGPDNTVRLVIRPDGAVYHGNRMSDAKDVTLHLARMCQARGQPPVVQIQADDSVTHGQFVRGVIGPCARAGIQKFHCLSYEGGPITVYPTVLAWTNEWKWHGMFTNDFNLHTNSGLNLRVLGDGVLINGSHALLSELPKRLSDGCSAGIGRASVTAADDARLKDVLYLLKTCDGMNIEATVFHRDHEGANKPLEHYVGNRPPSETIGGFVVQKAASTKSYDAWNAPSDPYYVLEQDSRKTTLRPSASVPTADLAALRGKRVLLKGYPTEGEPYQPANEGEQYPLEPVFNLGTNNAAGPVKMRPANRGRGFVVTRIVEMK
jgi:hypothetical protein